MVSSVRLVVVLVDLFLGVELPKGVQKQIGISCSTDQRAAKERGGRGGGKKDLNVRQIEWNAKKRLLLPLPMGEIRPNKDRTESGDEKRKRRRNNSWGGKNPEWAEAEREGGGISMEADQITERKILSVFMHLMTVPVVRELL